MGEFREPKLGWASRAPGPRATWGSYLYSASWGVHWSWSLQKTSVGSLNPHVVWLAGSPPATVFLWLGHHLLCGPGARLEVLIPALPPSAVWPFADASPSLCLWSVNCVGRTVGSAGLSRAFLQGPGMHPDSPYWAPETMSRMVPASCQEWGPEEGLMRAGKWVHVTGT